MRNRKPVSSKRPAHLQFKDFTSGVVQKLSDAEGTSEDSMVAFRRTLRRVITALLFLSVGAVLYLMFNASIGTTNVTFADELGVDAPAIDQSIESYLDERPLERLAPFLNEAALTTQIKASYNAVSSVRYSKSLFSRDLEVTVQGRSTAALLQKGSVYLALDQTGLAHTEVTNAADYPGKPIIQDKSGLSPAIGEQLVLPSFIRFAVDFTEVAAEDASLTISSFIIPEQSREIHVLLKDQPELYMRIDQSPIALFKDAQDTLSFLSENNATASYVDLRIDGRATYK